MRFHWIVAVEKVATLGRGHAATGVTQIVAPLRDDQSRDDYDRLSLDYGSRVRILGNLSDRRGYLNPGSPDFDEMLEHRGFDATGVVKARCLLKTWEPALAARFFICFIESARARSPLRSAASLSRLRESWSQLCSAIATFSRVTRPRRFERAGRSIYW